MDDITIYGETFEDCMSNLENVLNICIEKNLVLNWENVNPHMSKYQFSSN